MRWKAAQPWSQRPVLRLGRSSSQPRAPYLHSARFYSLVSGSYLTTLVEEYWPPVTATVSVSGSDTAQAALHTPVFQLATLISQFGSLCLVAEPDVGQAVSARLQQLGRLPAVKQLYRMSSEFQTVPAV